MIKKMFVASLITTLFAATAAFAMDPVMEGRVEYVDPAGNSVTLAGGTTLVPDPNLSIAPLHEGQDVTFEYHTGADGQKEISAFWIDSDREGSSD